MTETKILPFCREVWMADGDEFKAEVQRIMEAKPVKNLTEDEVVTTLRFLELKAFLLDRNHIVVHNQDPRLELCDDNDRFLAMLADCDRRETLLTTKRCRHLFGGTVYHWRKIAHKCPITDVASALSECSSGYYGRGWVIAQHIEMLISYILETSTYARIQKLK